MMVGGRDLPIRVMEPNTTRAQVNSGYMLHATTTSRVFLATVNLDREPTHPASIPDPELT